MCKLAWTGDEFVCSMNTLGGFNSCTVLEPEEQAAEAEKKAVEAEEKAVDALAETPEPRPASAKRGAAEMSEAGPPSKAGSSQCADKVPQSGGEYGRRGGG